MIFIFIKIGKDEKAHIHYIHLIVDNYLQPSWDLHTQNIFARSFIYI